MKKNKIIYFIISCLILLSCSDNQKKLKYLICKNDIQYWKYEWPRKRAEYYGFTFSFDKNGNVVKYSFNKVRNERWIFSDNLNPEINKWSVTEDSIFSNMGSSNKIIKYTEDTIYTIDINTHTRESYIRVKGDLHIMKGPSFEVVNKKGDTLQKPSIQDL